MVCSGTRAQTLHRDYDGTGTEYEKGNSEAKVLK